MSAGLGARLGAQLLAWELVMGARDVLDVQPDTCTLWIS